MKLYKSLALSALVALVLVMPMQASAYFNTFFGEDLYPGGSVAGATNSQAAANAFYAQLTGVGVETFDSYSPGTTAPLAVSFGTAGTATLSGSGIVETDTSYGRFPISGRNFWEVNSGNNFLITFSANVAAFGFWGTDMGDFSNQLVLSLSNGNVYNIPHTISAPSGSALFWGIIDTGNLFGSLTISNTGTGGDVFGFDDFTIGSRQQVVPEPSTFMLLGLSLLGLMALRSKFRK